MSRVISPAIRRFATTAELLAWTPRVDGQLAEALDTDPPTQYRWTYSTNSWLRMTTTDTFDLVGAEAKNTTDEVTIHESFVPGGALGPNGRLSLIALGDYFQKVSAPDSHVVTIKVYGTAIGDDVLDAGDRLCRFDIDVPYTGEVGTEYDALIRLDLFNVDDETKSRGSLSLQLASSNSGVVTTIVDVPFVPVGNSNIDTAEDWNLIITAQLEVADIHFSFAITNVHREIARIL